MFRGLGSSPCCLKLRQHSQSEKVMDSSEGTHRVSRRRVSMRGHVTDLHFKQNPQSLRQNSRPSQQIEEPFLSCGSKSFRLKFARCCSLLTSTLPKVCSVGTHENLQPAQYVHLDRTNLRQEMEQGAL